MTLPLSRRVFIRRTGLAALGLGAVPGSLLVRTAEAAREGDSVFVLVFLRGGADGLSLCPPHGDPEYYRQRPTIGLPEPGRAGSDSIVDLDGRFGLHPGLRPLGAAYAEGRLAVLHAVGHSDLGRSHFDAQEFVETGTPAVKGTPTGFLNRCLAGTPETDLMEGVTLSPLLARAFYGPEATLVVRDVSRLDFEAPHWRGETGERLARMYAASELPVGPTGRDALRAIDILKATPQIGAPPENGAAYPDSPAGQGLRQAAQIIKAPLGTRCLFVDFPGEFDTHSRQVEQNARDYAALGSALAAFDQDLGRRMDRVVVMVVTEFGRAVYENGALGTDHGTAGAMLLLGGRVNGGRVLGRWPGIEKAQLHLERDLAVTTDYRDALAEVAREHLGVTNAASLFPGYTPGRGPGVIRA